VEPVGNLRHPFDKGSNEVLDALLRLLLLAVGVEIHLNFGEGVREQFELAILLLGTYQFLVQAAQDSVVKFRVAHARTDEGTVALCYESAGSEYHAMVEVLDAKIEVKAIVDAGGQLVDALLVDCVCLVEAKVVSEILQVSDGLYLVGSLEDPDLIAVVEDSYDFLIARLDDSSILQDLLGLFGAELDVRSLDLKNKGHVTMVMRKVPSVRFVGDAGKAKLVEGRELPHAAICYAAIAKAKGCAGFVAHLILGHCLSHCSVLLLLFVLPTHWTTCY